MPIGSNFDDFLKEEGIYEVATASAMKKVLALQIEESMKAQQLTKTAMAKRMHTSRAALNRLLDDTDTSLTLTTLASAAAALGQGVRIELVAESKQLEAIASYDELKPTQPVKKLEGGKFELKKSKTGDYFFNLLAANGQVILQSEMYVTKDAALHGIESVKRNASNDSRYKRLQSISGQPYFVIRAGNSKILGQSRIYSSTKALESSIQFCKSSATAM
jgi:antitoxin HicB